MKGADATMEGADAAVEGAKVPASWTVYLLMNYPQLCIMNGTCSGNILYYR